MRITRTQQQKSGDVACSMSCTSYIHYASLSTHVLLHALGRVLSSHDDLGKSLQSRLCRHDEAIYRLGAVQSGEVGEYRSQTHPAACHNLHPGPRSSGSEDVQSGCEVVPAFGHLSTSERSLILMIASQEAASRMILLMILPSLLCWNSGLFHGRS
jgi:hypothetical protein